MSDAIQPGAEEQAAPPPPKTVAQMLGEIVWLMGQSPQHKQLFIGDLEWFCMPALVLEQYRISYGPKTPAAVVLWASISDETEQRLAAGGSRLRPDEWRNGDNLWLVELVAPFGGEDVILKDLFDNVFDGRAFKFHRTGPDGRRSVATYDAAGVPPVH